MGKPKPKNKDKVLAQKREREKLRYQTIKSNPELYEEYQRNNIMKYENQKVQKKILLINEMTSRQQEIQRKKWREERRRRYQRNKIKKAKERQLITENSPHESCFEQVQLDASEGKKNEIVKETFCDSTGMCDTTHDAVVIKEEPLCEENVFKPKPKCKEEDLAQKREREKLRYQTIKSNPELFAKYQRNNNVKYENQKVQKKILLINEMTSRQQEIQRKKWREERRRRYQRDKDKKAKDRKFNTENSPHESWFEQVQLDASEGQKIFIVKETFCDSMGTCDTTHNAVVIKEEPLYQENLFKPKPKCKEEVLAQKRERERLRYQTIKSNPELFAKFQRNNNMKYEKQKVQKKILLINEMTSRQQEIQQKKWREERRRRYQRNKDKKAKERQLNTENSPHESAIEQVQLNASERQGNVIVKETFCDSTGTCDITHDAVVIKEKPLSKEGSRASHDPLTSLYPDHEVKEELVLGPECLHRPGAPAALHTAVSETSSSARGPPTDIRNPQSGQDSPSSSKHTPKPSHTTKKHPCQTCGKEFKRAYHLKCHILTHTGLKPYTCEVCKKDFRFISNLIPHRRIHTRERPFSCEICKMSFVNSGALKNHKRIHSGVKPYSCDICNKTFRVSDTLNRHKRTHSGEKPYLCLICNKRFKETGCLKKHERIHTGDKPYSCEICQKKFTLVSNLKTHTRVHTGEKPYACEICGRKFSQLINLKKHEKIHSRETVRSNAKSFTGECSLVTRTDVRYEENNAEVEIN